MVKNESAKSVFLPQLHQILAAQTSPTKAIFTYSGPL
jgi:hypothetical protein